MAPYADASASNLPAGWREACLPDLGDHCLGKMLDNGKERAGVRMPYLRNVNVRWGKFALDDLLEMPFEAGDHARYGIEDGDLIVCEGGEPGRCAVWRGGSTALKLQKALHRVRLRDGHVPEFFAYQLLWLANSGHLARFFTGTTIKHLPGAQFKRVPFRYPPPDHQRRIVARIEELFGEIEAGEQELAEAKADLGRYRRAVLRAAVTGELTRAWREQNPPAETGGDLLARILQEPGDTSKVSRREDRDKPTDQERELFELPSGWVWTTLRDVARVTGGLTKHRARDALPLVRPYLRVANVYEGRFDLSVLKTIGVEESELHRVTLQSGDLLFVEGNGSPAQIGRVAIWDHDIEGCVHQNHLIKARFSNRAIADWAMYWFMSPAGRGCIARIASSTSGLFTLSISKISALALPLPSIKEATMAANRVKSMLESALELEASTSEQATDAAKLRQSILAAAFSGRLLSHDDTPASEAA